MSADNGKKLTRKQEKELGYEMIGWGFWGKRIGLHKRIENIDRVRKAYIMWEDVPIAELFHEYSTLSGEFDWVIKPIWENWDKADKRGGYVDIAGIDDTKHQEEYIRKYDPEFVTQRTVPDGREDLNDLLKDIGLRYNDLYEVLCRTHGVCGNDYYYVSRTPDIVVDLHQRIVPYDIPDFNTLYFGMLTCNKENMTKHDLSKIQEIYRKQGELNRYKII